MRFAKFGGLSNLVSWERQNPVVRSKGDEPIHNLDSANNVYLDDSGQVARRDGTVEVIAGAAHSLWSNGEICLYAQGSTLKRLLPDNTSETIRTDLSGDPVSYFFDGYNIYYSDGTITGQYSELHGILNWGVREPNLLSAAVIAGNLPAGRYGYTATFTDDIGREGGTTRFGSIVLTEQGGIRFTLPEWLEQSTISVYVTTTDGDVLYLLATKSSGSTADYTSGDRLFLALDTAHKSQPPAGNIVSSYRGHALVANDVWLFYSEPYAYHLFDRRSYLPFDSEVRIIAPVQDGIYVATREKTYFLGGDTPSKLTLITVADHGAIKGSLVYVESSDIGGLEKLPSQPVAIWSSSAGICAGANEGLFINLTESRYKFDEVADRGASVVLQMGGSNQFITSII